MQELGAHCSETRTRDRLNSVYINFWLCAISTGKMGEHVAEKELLFIHDCFKKKFF